MVYCISDLHGCYDEFMALIKKIKFDPSNDAIYILGDVIDRGDKSIDCLKYIMNTNKIYLLKGNHEQMMLDYYDGIESWSDWDNNGNKLTKKQYKSLDAIEREKIITYLRSRPYYKTLIINDNHFFLSHSGLDVSKTFKDQPKEALIWSREEFYDFKALEKYICIFGHTPTFYMHVSADCSIWLDNIHMDKICIDCGCVYEGALAALRLDDGEVFYVKSRFGKIAPLFTLNKVKNIGDFLKRETKN